VAKVPADLPRELDPGDHQIRKTIPMWNSVVLHTGMVIHAMIVKDGTGAIDSTVFNAVKNIQECKLINPIRTS
jgi:hypothetical protein